MQCKQRVRPNIRGFEFGLNASRVGSLTRTIPQPSHSILLNKQPAAVAQMQRNVDRIRFLDYPTNCGIHLHAK